MFLFVDVQALGLLEGKLRPMGFLRILKTCPSKVPSDSLRSLGPFGAKELELLFSSRNTRNTTQWPR